MPDAPTTQPTNLRDRARRAGQAAFQLWGRTAQLDMAKEEAAEFIVALCHLNRYRAGVPELVEEMADLHIMLAELEAGLPVDPADVDAAVARKLDRLEQRIRDDAPTAAYCPPVAT